MVSVLTFLVTIASRGNPARAEPPDKQACAEAFERSQRLRLEQHFVDAKKALILCVQDSCPAVLRTDCRLWLGEVDAALPSVVFEIRDSDGSPLLDADVTVDGVPLTAHLDGRSMEIDPGVHVFRFSRASRLPVERTVPIREGEKRQVVRVTFESHEAKRHDEAAPRPAHTPTALGERPWALTLGLTAVGVVAFGSFVIFGLSARADQDGSLERCRPSCAHDDVQSVATRYLVADLSLLASLLALGGAAVVWSSGGKPHSP